MGNQVSPSMNNHMTDNIETSLLELLSHIDKSLFEFCKDSSIESDDEVIEIWKMFRKENEIYN